jgi:hypothetical protein
MEKEVMYIEKDKKKKGSDVPAPDPLVAPGF